MYLWLRCLIVGWLTAFGVTLQQMHDQAISDALAEAEKRARDIEQYVTQTLEMVDVLAIGLQPGGKLTPCGHHGVAQTEANQMGDLKRPMTPAIRPACRALGGDMPQGVGSLVAKAGGIGSTANPQGVEHQNDSAGHQ